jgi:hypothetical protein
MNSNEQPRKFRASRNSERPAALWDFSGDRFGVTTKVCFPAGTVPLKN